MKYCKLFFFIAFTLFGFSAFSQSSKTLDIYFYEQPLMFFRTEKTNEYAGVEADILKEFFKWCEEKKKIKVTPKYHNYKNFNDFYNAMSSASESSIGAGTVTINNERRKTFDFSAPYLKNVALFVSHGSVPTFTSSANQPAAAKSLSGVAPTPQYSKLVGLAEKGSVHSVYMKNFIATHANDMQMEAVSGNLSEILLSDPKYVAYMDIITYRELIKNSDKYFKIHRELTMNGENFGFILPKNSEWVPLVNEFMESGFGFTATRKYQDILEKYLGYEVISTVEIFNK
jgi:hypothetical protein